MLVYCQTVLKPQLKFNSSVNPLVIQWLGLSTFTLGAQVQSLISKLRTCKPYSMAKNKQTKLNSK